MKNATEVDGGVGALVWCGGAYNDRNGCDGATQVQRFPIHALKLPLQLMELGGGGRDL